MRLSMENFGKRCGALSTLYIQMNMPRGEAYQSSILINASIATYDMQGRSYSKIIMYIGIMKSSNNYMINP